MKPSALLIGVVAVAAVAGVAISTAQRPPAPPPAPSPTPSPVPTPVPAAPVAGSGFSVADDPSSGQIVLFGGVDDDANTWIWARGRWTLENPSLSPPGRIDAAEAYDPSTQQVLLFGGRHNPFSNGAPLNDTWAWNGASWIEVDNGVGGPTPGEGSSMAWDPALREMVLVTSAGNASGGDATWVWFGAHWQNQPHGAVAYGEIIREVDLFKGRVLTNQLDREGAWLSLWRNLRFAVSSSPAVVMLCNSLEDVRTRFR